MKKGDSDGNLQSKKRRGREREHSVVRLMNLNVDNNEFREQADANKVIYENYVYLGLKHLKRFSGERERADARARV